jgi:catechol 2,3-dioxygenase-like lactoylglutathione lyase family enzyme
MPQPYFARGIPLLPVASVRRSIEFYVDVLDFKMGFNAGEYGGVRRDAIEIHFRRTDDPNLAKNSSCRIEVTEIHKLYSLCRERGVVDPAGDIAAQTWGSTEFVILDPDGNRITFVEVFGLGS